MTCGATGPAMLIARRLAAALAMAALIPPAAVAQQGQDANQDGGIVTEKLEPLLPHGERPGEGEATLPDGESPEGQEASMPRGRQFKPAPFRTPEAPVQPERIEPVETVLKPGARVRQLDKLTGRSETVEIAAGDEIMIDRLRVRLAACRAPEDNAEHGTKAFLKIWDIQDPIADPVFSGWMFAESPALSAMDHQRYDLWVMSCITASAQESSASE